MLSEKIRELRRTKGLSQEELADYFGVSLDYLLRDDCSTEQPGRPSSPKKCSAARRILGAFLIGAAVFAVIVLVILRLTGNGGSVTDSSTVTLNGSAIVIGAAVLCAVSGIVILITSGK